MPISVNISRGRHDYFCWRKKAIVTENLLLIEMYWKVREPYQRLLFKSPPQRACFIMIAAVLAFKWQILLWVLSCPLNIAPPFLNVLSNPQSSYCLKSGSHSGKLKGTGPLEHLVFNGSTAVVKQCAEIILIRLGQSDDKMSLVPPSFSSKIQRTISA